MVFVDTFLSSQRPCQALWRKSQKGAPSATLSPLLRSSHVITIHVIAITRAYTFSIYLYVDVQCLSFDLRAFHLWHPIPHSRLCQLCKGTVAGSILGFVQPWMGEELESGGTLWSVVPKSPNIKYRTPIQGLFCNLFAFNVTFTWHDIEIMIGFCLSTSSLFWLSSFLSFFFGKACSIFQSEARLYWYT